MRKRILAFIMSSVLTFSFINISCIYAEDIDAEYGEVVVTVIDKETNELFKEHSKFGLTMLDDKWDASKCNPYTKKNVPKDNSYFITYDPDGEKYDGYYYRIDNYVLFKLDEGEDTKNVTVYMEKRPVERSSEYGTIIVSVIDENTNELLNAENDNTSVSLFRTPLNFPKEGQFGGTIQIDEWNIGQSNPHVIEQVETNYSYTLNYSMMFFNTQYTVDVEKTSETTFEYLSSEPKEIKIYIKKNILADHDADAQPSETDTSEKPDIQSDKDYSFDDIRSMTTDELEALYKAKGIKNYHVYTAKSAVGSILLEPRPYLSDDVPDDVITEIHDISEVSELLESQCRFDIDKVKKSLGLPAELFDISFGIMMPVGHEENGEYIMKKYCECMIQPVTYDQQTKAELLADALNYIQLNPDYCGTTPFAGVLGGSDITAPSTTLRGDVNSDGIFDICDIVALQRWLLGADGAELADWKAADLCADNKLDVFDLTALKKALLEKSAQ